MKKKLTILFMLFVLVSTILPTSAASKFSKKKLSYKVYQLESNAVLQVTNKNKQDAYFEFTMKFYKSNKLVDAYSMSYCLVAKNGIAFQDYSISNEDYDSVKVSLNATKENDYKMVTSKIKATGLEKKDELKIIIKNKNKFSVEYAVTAVYYKEGSVVFIDKSIGTTISKKSEYVDCAAIPYDSNDEPIQYDSYKLFINSYKSN